MNKSLLPQSKRLKDGAVLLGQLWLDPANRCTAGWSLDPCKCVPQLKFCKARNLWITLALDDWMAGILKGDESGRDMDDGPFGLAVSMISSEWDATGLLLKMAHPTIGEILVGSGANRMTTMQDLANLMDSPESLSDILTVMKTFKNSKVLGVEVPPTAAPAAIVAVAEVDLDEAFE